MKSFSKLSKPTQALLEHCFTLVAMQIRLINVAFILLDTPKPLQQPVIEAIARFYYEQDLTILSPKEQYRKLTKTEQDAFRQYYLECFCKSVQFMPLPESLLELHRAYYIYSYFFSAENIMRVRQTLYFSINTFERANIELQAEEHTKILQALKVRKQALQQYHSSAIWALSKSSVMTMLASPITMLLGCVHFGLAIVLELAGSLTFTLLMLDMVSILVLYIWQYLKACRRPELSKKAENFSQKFSQSLTAKAIVAVKHDFRVYCNQFCYPSKAEKQLDSFLAAMKTDSSTLNPQLHFHGTPKKRKKPKTKETHKAAVSITSKPKQSSKGTFLRTNANHISLVDEFDDSFDETTSQLSSPSSETQDAATSTSEESLNITPAMAVESEYNPSVAHYLYCQLAHVSEYFTMQWQQNPYGFWQPFLARVQQFHYRPEQLVTETENGTQFFSALTGTVDNIVYENCDLMPANGY